MGAQSFTDHILSRWLNRDCTRHIVLLRCRSSNERHIELISFLISMIIPKKTLLFDGAKELDYRGEYMI